MNLRTIWIVVLMFALLMPMISKAQTFQQATSTGHYDVGYGNTVVNVNVLKGIYPTVAPYPFISLQGPVGVVTNSWRVSGNVLSAAFSWQYSYGALVPHAVLVSKPTTLYYFIFPYGIKPAHVVVTLTQLEARGQGGFQVISDDIAAGDVDKVLFESRWNGQYAEYPFTAGGVTIIE